jgi:hypothetical protein
MLDHEETSLSAGGPVMRNRALKMLGSGLGLMIGVFLVAGPIPDARAVTVTPTITSVVFTGSYANPSITITGKGFGTVPYGTTRACGDGPGKDFVSHLLYVQDFTSQLVAGGRGDPICLVVSTYSSTTIKMRFGSFYYLPGTNQKLLPGDQYKVSVRGATHSGLVHFT